MAAWARIASCPSADAENDRHAAAIYALNFGDHVICGDIREVTDFRAADVVIGGPPCQGFSRLGKKTHGRPTETSFKGNGLWVEYMRCVEQVQPLMFVVENVPDFLRHLRQQVAPRR